MILRELFATFGFEFDGSPLVAGHNAVEGLVDEIKDLGSAITASAFVVGIGTLIHDMTELGEETANTAAQFGLSSTELTEWRYIATQAGLSVGQLDGIMQSLAQSVDRATTGDSRMAAEFRRLGVATRDANRHIRPLNDVMEDVGVALNNIEGDTERAAVSMRIFGSNGRRLIPAFADGRDGIAAMREEVRRLYGTDLERLSEVSADYNAELGRWDLALNAIRTSLVLDLLPVMRYGVGLVAEWMVSFRQLSRGTNVLELGLVGLAVAAAAAGIVMLTPFIEPLIAAGLLAIAIGAVVLVVDDLLTLFQGGESAVGGFIDDMLGAGSAAEFVERNIRAWHVTLRALNFVLDLARTAMVAMFGEEGTSRLTTFSGWLGFIHNQFTMAVIVARELFTWVDGMATRAREFVNAVGGGNSREGVDRALSIASGVSGGGVVGSAIEGARSIINNVAPVFNVTGASDPEATANVIMGRMREVEDSNIRRGMEALIPTVD